MPSVADFGSDRACNIYGNVHQILVEKSDWNTLYEGPLNMLALTCDEYLVLAEADPGSAGCMEVTKAPGERIASTRRSHSTGVRLTLLNVQLKSVRKR